VIQELGDIELETTMRTMHERNTKLASATGIRANAPAPWRHRLGALIEDQRPKGVYTAF